MRTGDVIKCTDGTEFTVTKQGREGGQGSTWFLKDKSGKGFVLKILNEKDYSKKSKKIENIQNLYNKKDYYLASLANKNFTVALPIRIYRKESDFGYVMSFCSGKEINDLMVEKTFVDMPTNERIGLVKRIAEAIDWLQKMGLCYQDISHKNFMYSAKDNTISLIDCDNLMAGSDASRGKMKLVKGSSFFIAPEIAFRNANPSPICDNYALAVLFYKIMTGSDDTPYTGKVLYGMRPSPSNMFEAAELIDEYDDIDEKDFLTFIFDKNNKVNSVSQNMFKSNRELSSRINTVIKNWANVPDGLKELFYRAFNNPLDPVAQKRRPMASEWMREAQKNLDGNSVVKSVVNSSVTSNQANSVQGHLSVLFSNGSRVQINGDYVFDGSVVGLGKSAFGRIKKNGEKYTFVSDCIYQISSNDKSIKLYKGNSVDITNGMELFVNLKPSKKIIFSI